MPIHSHSAITNNTGGHTHSLSVKYGTQGSSSWNAFGKSYNNYSWVDDPSSYSIGNAGAHSHTVTVDNSGAGKTHNNMSPYVAVYMWRRIQ